MKQEQTACGATLVSKLRASGHMQSSTCSTVLACVPLNSRLTMILDKSGFPIHRKLMYTPAGGAHSFKNWLTSTWEATGSVHFQHSKFHSRSYMLQLFTLYPSRLPSHRYYFISKTNFPSDPLISFVSFPSMPQQAPPNHYVDSWTATNRQVTIM